MRLDRYISVGHGKFSIIEHHHGDRVTRINDPAEDFIVLKLKDLNTPAALRAYADHCQFADPDLAGDMRRLAIRAEHYPGRKEPD